jgi:hypothetical protein
MFMRVGAAVVGVAGLGLALLAALEQEWAVAGGIVAAATAVCVVLLRGVRPEPTAPKCHLCNRPMGQRPERCPSCLAPSVRFKWYCRSRAVEAATPDDAVNPRVPDPGEGPVGVFADDDGDYVEALAGLLASRGIAAAVSEPVRLSGYYARYTGWHLVVPEGDAELARTLVDRVEADVNRRLDTDSLPDDDEDDA